MAVLSALTDFLPEMQLKLPAADAPAMTQALRSMAREFCERTETWREALEPIAIVDWQQDYALAPPANVPSNEVFTAFTGQIQRILIVLINSDFITGSSRGNRPPPFFWDGHEAHVGSRAWPRHAFHEQGRVQLVHGNTLRFRSDDVPNDNLDHRLTVCPTMGSTTIADWLALTAASTGITTNGSTVALTGMNFSGATTFADIALIIQTAWRNAQDDNIGHVRVFGDHFVFWVEDGTMGFTIADATGTDISGASWLNGLTSGSATNSPNLQVVAAILPDNNTDILPNEFLDRWGKGIMWGAIAEMAGRQNMPWRDSTVAADAQTKANRVLSKGISEKSRNFESGPVTIGA